jgi:hypothetical protein
MASKAENSGRTWWRGRAAGGCLTTLVGLVAIAILATGWAKHRGLRASGEMHSAWVSGPGAIDGRFLEAYPPRSTNEDALRLEDVAAPLGIDLAPREPGEGLPEEVARPVGFPMAEMRGYIASVAESPDDAVPSPPAAVQEFLDTHRGDLEEAIRSVLASRPGWDLEPARLPYPPTPNLSGHLQLEYALLVLALEREAEGNGSGPEAALEASWGLNQHLGARPEIGSALTYLRVLHAQAGVLRHMRRPSPRWIERLEAEEPVDRLKVGLRSEAWHTHELLVNRLDTAVETSDRIGRWVIRAADTAPVRPWWRLMWTDYLGAEAQFHQGAELLDPCASGHEIPARSFRQAISHANPIRYLGARIPEYLDRAWSQTRRQTIDLQGTVRVLAFKEALAGSPPRPRTPEELRRFIERAGLETASRCSGRVWAHTLATDPVAYVIHLEDVQLPDPTHAGLALPLEHRIPLESAR